MDPDNADGGVSSTGPSSVDSQDPANALHFTSAHRGPCFHILEQLATGEFVLYDARHLYTELVYFRPYHRPRLHPFAEETVHLPSNVDGGIFSMEADAEGTLPSSAPLEAARLPWANAHICAAVRRAVNCVRTRAPPPAPPTEALSPDMPPGPTASPASDNAAENVDVIFANGEVVHGEDLV